jgi:hypothetical protein
MRWFRLALAIGVAGCATLRPGEDNPVRSLDAGLLALAAGDYAAAVQHFDRAGLSPRGGSAGRRALLAATLARLDPRNPDRDFALAAERATRLRNDPDAEDWDTLAGGVLAALAADLENANEGMRQARRERHAAVIAAALAAQSVAARMSALTMERDTARRRAAQLEQTLGEKEKELRDTKQELDRIRRAIRR